MEIAESTLDFQPSPASKTIICPLAIKENI
jgi:hypothetical protein